jgi:hypothetical protein
MSDHDAEEASIISSYLDSKKFIRGEIKWKNKGNKDFSEVKLPVTCPAMPEIDGQLILTSHMSRIPQKISFTLVAGSTRITGLDVNPASWHFNAKKRESVRATHWQWYPLMEAEVDDRQLTHLEWLKEFCGKTNIELAVAYAAPPYEPVQLDLL